MGWAGSGTARHRRYILRCASISLPDEIAAQRSRPYGLRLIQRRRPAPACRRCATVIREPPVVPMTTAGTPCSAASCSSAVRSVWRDAHDDARGRLAEERRRDADERRGVASRVPPARPRRGRCPPCRTRTRPASPPGRRRSSRAPTGAGRVPPPVVSSAISARSRSRSSAGGTPLTSPWTTFRYSLPPSSPRFSPSRTIASPASRNVRLTHAAASSIRPTTPMVGVG